MKLMFWLIFLIAVWIIPIAIPEMKALKTPNILFGYSVLWFLLDPIETKITPEKAQAMHILSLTVATSLRKIADNTRENIGPVLNIMVFNPLGACYIDTYPVKMQIAPKIVLTAKSPMNSAFGLNTLTLSHRAHI